MLPYGADGTQEAADEWPSKETSSMVTIESTPAMAAKVYETMERNLLVVRRRLGRSLSLKVSEASVFSA